MRKVTILNEDILYSNDDIKAENMVYIENLGNIFNTNLDFQTIPETVSLAGVSFENRQLIIPKLKMGSSIRLIRDPHNQYDKYAIKVFYKNKHIGWVPKDIAFSLAQDIDSGIIWNGKIEKITGSEDTLRGIVVKLYHSNE